MISNCNDQNLKDDYFLLRKQFIMGVSRRLRRLGNLNDELQVIDEEELYTTLQSFHYELHKLTGAAGSYGFIVIENHSRDLENLVWTRLNQYKADYIGRELYDEFKPRLLLIQHAYFNSMEIIN